MPKIKSNYGLTQSMRQESIKTSRKPSRFHPLRSSCSTCGKRKKKEKTSFI